MSIILKALKKVQNQRVKRDPPPPAAEAAETQDLDPDAILAEVSSLETDNEEARIGVGIDQPSPLTGRSERIRHGFSFGPKALLGVILVLGIFTTGWFTSRIYVSINRSDAGAKEIKSPSIAREASEEPIAPHEPVASVSSVAEPRQSPESEPSSEPVSPGITREMAPPVEPAVVAEAVSPIQSPQSPAIPIEPTVDQEPPEALTYQAEPADVGLPISPSQTVREAALVEQATPSRAVEPEEKEPEPKRQGRPELKINAIAWRAREPKAVVNMQSVRVGDIIEGAEVLTIEKKMIRFEYEGEEFDVRF